MTENPGEPKLRRPRLQAFPWFTSGGHGPALGRSNAHLPILLVASLLASTAAVTVAKLGVLGRATACRLHGPPAAILKRGRRLRASMQDGAEAPLVEVSEAARRFKAGEVILLDVREASELKQAAVKGALHIPMRQVTARVAELPRDKPILVMCHHGGRSQAVADFLKPQGFDVGNVAGGIAAWAAEVDPRIPQY